MSVVSAISDRNKPLTAVAAMVSGQGRGSNLGALIEACASDNVASRMAVVIATRSDSPAAQRARDAKIPVVVISPRKYESDDAAYGQAILRALRNHNADLICLAGYMRKLPPGVVTTYAGRIMNVHPALLPLFGGQGMYGELVHRAVLDSGMKVTGCTVHFVDEHYDTGPIIVQESVPVLEDDTPASLSARVLCKEHEAYVRAVSLFANGRLRIDGQRVHVLSSDA